MICSRAIPYVDNTLKNINRSYDLYVTFSSTLYNDKKYLFDHLFREYTKYSVRKIDNLELLE